MTSPVWAVASESAAHRWAEALEAAGRPALALPWSRIVEAPGARDVEARLQRSRWDLVLLTSPNAPRVLGEGVGHAVPAACVGEATAAAARRSGFEVVHVGDGTGADLARQLVADVEPGRVLFLRGREVRPEAIGILAEAGFEVVSVVVYAAEALEDFGDRLRAADEPVAFAVGSPRAATALASALDAVGRGGLRSRPALAIGETTAGRLGELGFASVHVPEAPGASGLASLAETVLNVRPWT